MEFYIEKKILQNILNTQKVKFMVYRRKKISRWTYEDEKLEKYFL